MSASGYAPARPSGPPPGIPAYPSPARAWYGVTLLTLACIVSFVDRQIPTLMVGSIRRDLGLSDTQVSLLIGLGFAVCYTISGLPWGRLADIHSRRAIIGVSMGAWSLLTAASGLTRSFWPLIACRAGVGIAEGGLAPAAYSLIGDSFPPERRSTAMSVYAMGVYVGSGLALILGGAAIQLVGSGAGIDLPLLGAMRPWQMVFLAVGLPGIPAALLLATVREPARQELGTRRADVSVPLSEVWRYFTANRATFLCHNLGLACLSLASYGAACWTPTLFMRRFHWSAAQTGVILGAVILVGGTLGVLCGGRFADWWFARGWRDANLRVALFGALAWLPFGALYPLASSATWAVVLLIPATFCGSLPFGVAAAAIQQLVPNQLRGQASAAYLLTVGLIGQGAGPTAVALLTDYAFCDDQAIHLSLVVVGVCGHIAGATLLTLALRPYLRSLDHLAGWKGELVPPRHTPCANPRTLP